MSVSSSYREGVSRRESPREAVRRLLPMGCRAFRTETERKTLAALVFAVVGVEPGNTAVAVLVRRHHVTLEELWLGHFPGGEETPEPVSIEDLFEDFGGST